MANISNYLEEALLDHVFRNVEFTRPGATLYVAIFEETKSEAELEANNRTGEITGYTGTDRPSVTFSQQDPFQNVGTGAATIVSAAAVEYLDMPALTVGYAAVMDSAAHAGGNILYWMKLTLDKNTNAGDTFRFPAGDIVIDLD